MRIERLDLLAFGPFRDQTLDFSADSVHMVFGRNEAGKSSTLRAIEGLLYGIDTRTRDAHVHKPAELRVGGVLRGNDGTRLRVVRRKGVSKGGPSTLLDEQGQVVDEALLQRLLRGVSEETFKHAFGLDHDTLARGAEALLEGRGDVGGSLFDASVGGGGAVRRLLNELEVEADKLYKPRGSTLPLNVALKSFTDLQKSVKEKERLPAAYVLQQTALETARVRHQDLVARRAELVRRRFRIDNARRRVPLERKRALALATLDELGETVRHATRIAGLHSRLSAYELAKVAQGDDIAAAERLRDNAADAADRAGIATGSSDLRIDARTQALIRRYIQERTTLTERLDNTRLELGRSERELERLRAELSAVEAVDPVHAAALSRALEHARKLGDATGLFATQTARAARKRAEIEARAAALGVDHLTFDQVLALRPPPASSLDALEARAIDLDRDAARQADRLVELSVQSAAMEQQLAAASGDFAPPTAADLRAARERRDHMWQRMHDAGSDAALGSAFERAVLDADAVADRMIAFADRVTTLARYRAQLSTIETQRAEAQAARAATLAERRAVDEAHRLLWEKAGVVRDDVGLAEMRAWVVAHGQILDAFGAVRELVADAEDTARSIEAVRSALDTVLAGTSDSRDAPGAPLVVLVDRATARWERIEQSRRAVSEAAAATVKLEAQIDERKAILVRDEAARREVAAKLDEILEPLGIPRDAPGDEVMRSLDALRELVSFEQQRAVVLARTATNGSHISTFEDDVALLATALAPDLVGLPARDVVTELHSRSKRAEAAEQQRAEAESQLADAVVAGAAGDRDELPAEPEELLVMLEAVDAGLVEVEGELTRETRSIAQIEMGLDQMRADSGAAEASAQAQEMLARVRSDLERYVRAKVAGVILSREIDRYRQENQGPMLAKASELFACLTLRSYSGVRAGYDDKDRPTLRCVRDGNVEVDVAGLSEGTRDQLYLSLRLASLLRYAEVAEPMPLILDDVLVQFDDERSRAALAVLAELSSRMQIVFFTHHARMVDLAREAIPASSLTVHELTPPVRSSQAVLSV